MIRLDHVIKQYSRRGQSVTALQTDETRIAAGEYVAVVGSSGSGKTTLLSLLGGMLAPTSGRVWIDGKSLYDEPVTWRSSLRSERMGFVFQTFNLIPYLTAVQNVQVPLCLSRQPDAARFDRAARLLERFGLAERLHHRPSELSIGQQQRVALARTLVNDPQIILADEPTGNLDPASREVVLNAFDECHREGRTIVVVTHDPAVAKRAKRRLSLSAGSIMDDSASVLRKSA